MARRRRVRVRFGARSTVVRHRDEGNEPRGSGGGAGSGPDDPFGASGPPRRPRPLPGRDDGGAGVREPRRPKPTLPAMSAANEPEPDTYLDLAGRP